MKKFFTLKGILLLILFIFLFKVNFAQSIFTNPITDVDPSQSNPYTNGQSVDSKITVSGIGRSAVITGVTSINRYNAKTWSTGAIDLTKYFEFTITPISGYQIDFSSFVYTGQVSSGTPLFAIRSSIDGFTANIGAPNATGTTINLSAAAYQGITSPIVFRFYVYNIAAASTTYSLNDFTFNGVVSRQLYFRSQQSGDWNDPNTWVSSSNNMAPWNSSATLIPSYYDKTITILNGNIVNVSSSISLDETIVSNGTLKVNPGGILNIYDESGIDLNVSAAGILDAGNTAIISNASAVSINVDGQLRTSYATGLTGAGALISSGILTLNNTSSTVEYYAGAAQAITARADYYNVTFSGSGSKTPSGPFTPAGTIYVTGSAILNAVSNNISGTSPNTTNLKMDGGRLILGTTGTLPGMEGAYALTGGIVEFANTNATTQTIRNKSYQNIEVTGNNVGNSSGNITLNANGTFTVKTNGIFQIKDNNIVGAGVGGTQIVTVESGGIFRCGNNQGFNGFTATFTNNSSISSNITNINLIDGSTVEYIGNSSGTQPITNANGLTYSNILFSGTGVETAPSTTLIIRGNFTKSGSNTFLHNNGTILFNGGATAQSYTSNAEVLFNNLTNNNQNIVTGLSINNDLAIAGQLTLNANSKFNLTSGNVTLKSTAVATANVAEIPAGATISYGSGLFVVERYIPALRAWRFLSVPVNSSKTIHEQWQEGQLPNSTTPTGFGIQITSNRPTWAVDSFDLFSAGGPSMKTYNPFTDSYEGIASTHVPFDTSFGGYMTFIRGDRTVNTFPAPPKETVLRTKGKLFTGTQSLITIPADKFMPVNNPYASRLQLSKLNKSQQFFFYVWDPKLGGATSANGLGAFQALSWNSDNNNYDVVPGGGSYGLTADYIESGQAFFAYYLSGGNLTMQEDAKAGGSSVVFTPNQFPVPHPQLRTNLFNVNADGTASLVDGILNSFSDNYSNEIDEMDAAKMTNTGENLSVKNSNKLLAIDRRHTVTASDTIFLNLHAAIGQYRFEFAATDLNTGLSGYIEDNYLHTKTTLDLSGSTFIDFSINAEEASSASNRFRIVLNAPEAGPLPVTITNVKAYVQNANIAVEWKVVNESGIQQYEIEKSLDGIHFQKSGSVAAKNLPANNYKWLDEHAVVGYNYYRLRVVDFDGKINYSNVVKVLVENIKPAITIYPNPITGGLINLLFINQPKGEYSIRLLNKLGQVIMSRQINHAGGNSSEAIRLDASVVHGMYQVEVVQPGNNKKYFSVLY